MTYMIILNVTKNQGFTLTLEDTVFEKPQEEGGCGQIDPQAVLGLREQQFYGMVGSVCEMIIAQSK